MDRSNELYPTLALQIGKDGEEPDPPATFSPSGGLKVWYVYSGLSCGPVDRFGTEITIVAEDLTLKSGYRRMKWNSGRDGS
jgi:hypothetical protein